MQHLKNIFCLLLIASVSLFGTSLNQVEKPSFNWKPPIKWIVEKSSTLRISGKSNVNAFSCSIIKYNGTDTIYCSEDGERKTVRLNGGLEIDVFEFDCKKQLITKDLRKTLKEKQYPKLFISFLTLESLPSIKNKTQNIKGWVEVELAGVRRCFQIPFEFSNHDGNSFVLNGKKVFCFSDFKLSAPQKLGGAIQVKDEFIVDFGLKMRSIK